MGQKDGEKWTAAVDSQPTLPKSDRLLAAGAGCRRAMARAACGLEQPMLEAVNLEP